MKNNWKERILDIISCPYTVRNNLKKLTIMIKISKYSFGTGDRFGMQGKAQLRAIIRANEAGIPLTPVWNKSNREHQIIHSSPEETRMEARNAVKEAGWEGAYFVDADHINLNNVDSFMKHSDFFTIDVADYIGKPADAAYVEAFVKNNLKYTGDLPVEGMDAPVKIAPSDLYVIAGKFLYAVRQAAAIYRHIAEKKGEGNFVTEVSMDEVDQPQTPVEMFFILSALAHEGVPVQTIAPKFSGRFNKGVDYVGDTEAFAREFEADILVIRKAVNEFGLPGNLKLSVHSGSDKFSIYPIMGELIRKHDAGIHVKTAGTTWLEEVIGLALAGDEPLGLAKSIYGKAYSRMEELCGPYATVIDIDKSKLPSPETVNNWSGEKFAGTLRHIPGHPDYNPGFRQLIHVGYKVAAEFSNVYLNLIRIHEDIVGRQVEENIYDRHLKRLFNL